jgi:aminopeptidase YwaD
MRRLVVAVAAVALLTACSGDDRENPGETLPSVSPSSTEQTPTEPSPTAKATPRVSPDDAKIDVAMRAVRHLANEIGPRPGHTPAYFRAAGWVQEQFESYGWDVTTQRFPTPAGSYEGVALESGPSVNVIATRGDVKPGKPWLAVGAHLDTVPQGPGAEDNASGIGSLLAIAEATQDTRTRLPLVLIAFGSEEPRGSTDADHHYGSRAYVAELSKQQRDSLRGMVSMDRVGVGVVLPIGSVEEPSPMRAELAAAARRAGVETLLETGQQSSDHWSFVREGLPGVRLGSTPYCCYHRPTDLPEIVDMAQLERTIRTVLAWLR